MKFTNVRKRAKVYVRKRAKVYVRKRAKVYPSLSSENT
jgi:hypothetical protein